MPNVSLSWLKDHVDVPEDATIEQLAEDLVAVGLEEEEIHPPSVTGPLVAGRVLSLKKEEHSNGKTVNYCRVDVGEFNDEPGTGKEKSELASRGIICGAHNFEVGDYVVVALPGAVLPGPFPIAARKTYGHVSDGMICSQRELGLGEDHSGIIVLPEPVTPGTDMIAQLGLGESVLEINVTPDRGYCFSMRGIAREYGHSTGRVFQDKGINPNTPAHSDSAFAVEVEDKSAADRFVTRVVRNVDVAAQTPGWMKERLLQAGMRPLSLTVDATNYVMLDLGQPLHAYALDSVSAPFVVRRAHSQEVFTTLDGVERILDAEDIVIADSPDGKRGSRIVGLAGTMGGLESEIESGTTDVVIEAAHFDAVAIARTSRRHKLITEASKRFERGVDPLLAAVAVQQVTDLLVEYGGGQADPEVFDYSDVKQPQPIEIWLSEPQRLTGVAYEPARIIELLQAIGATVEDLGDKLKVIPPSWRPDLVGPAHLVEEIARLDGYDKIDMRIPRPVLGHGLRPDQIAARRVADTAAQRGAVEVLSYPFIGDAHDRQGLPAQDSRRAAVKLRNPLADNAASLRTSLLDSLLDVAERNASRGNQSLAIFEMGAVTDGSAITPAAIPGVSQRPSEAELASLMAGVPAQPLHFAAVFAGPLGGSAAVNGGKSWGWADAIALVQGIGSALGVKIEVSRAWVPEGTVRRPGPPVPPPTHDAAQTAPWHPGRVANLFVRNGKELVVIGRGGELHPRVVNEYGLPARAAAAEIDLDVLFQLLPKAPVTAKRVSVYPPAKVDFAVVVDLDTPAADVERVIRSSAGQYFADLQLFDVYTGEQIPKGKRSLAFALTLRAADATLLPEQVQGTREKIVNDLQKRLGAELRS